MPRWSLLLVLSALLAVAPVAAQDGEGVCPAFVLMALESVGDACGNMARNEVCYGHNRVDAVFWEAREDLVFDAPASRVPVIDVRSLATSPLNLERDLWGVALLQIQANVPGTQPGQVVKFILMGDTTLANEVPPDEVVEVVEVTPVEATATISANLRSQPSPNANIVGGAAPGDELLLIGVNTAGDWYETTLDERGSAWIFGELVTVDDAEALTALPVTEGDDIAACYGPMQALYLTTGQAADLTCNEAPNALVVQSPHDVVVTFSINSLDVQLGSAAIFTIAEVATDQGAVPVLVGILLQGRLRTEVNGAPVDLEQPDYAFVRSFEAFAVTLNDAGQVDADSQLVEPPPDLLASVVEHSCRNAIQVGMIESLSRASCDAEVAYYAPPVAAPGGTQPTSGAAQSKTTPLAGVGETDACIVAARDTVNLRGGPGTNYPLQGQLAAGQTANPNGQATGADNATWLRLAGGSWVRSDLVSMAGDCGGIAAVEAPPAPTSPPAGGGGASVRIGMNGPNPCSPNVIPAGTQVTVNYGTGWPTEAEGHAGLASSTSTLTVNGQSLPVIRYPHPFCPPDLCPPVGAYGYATEAVWIASSPGVYVFAGQSQFNPPSCAVTVTD